MGRLIRKPFMEYHLVTGGTGLLGQYLVKELLAAGCRVVLLCRDGHLTVAQRRVDAIVSRFERETGRAWPRPVVIQGDLRVPGLGLSPADRKWLLDRVTQVVHSAASLKFQGRDRLQEPWLTNLTGLQHLLEFCDPQRIDSFCHVSTAYVCGTRTGQILETECNVGQAFGNEYEESKFLGEQLVRSAGFQRTTIFRPSIVVGDLKTGFTSTFHGFYAPLSLGWQLASRHGFRSGESEKLVAAMGLRERDRKNLVPVDWVAAVMARVILDPALHDRTYHLVNPRPVTADMLTEVVDTALRTSTEPTPGDDGLSASLNVSFEDGMEVYRSYMRDDPDFDSRATQAAVPDLPCPTLGREELLSLAQFAIREQFGLRRRPLPVPVADVAAFLPLKAAEAPASPPGESIWALDVTGSRGGTWTISGRGPRMTAEIGEPDEPAPRVRLSSATFVALLTGQWTVEEALYAGLVLVTAEFLPPGEIVARFEEWIEHSRQLVSQSKDQHTADPNSRISLIGGNR